MDDDTKKAARAEIRKRRDSLLMERAHFWWVRYFAEKRLKETEEKLSQAKSAAAFFDLKISYPPLQEHDRIAMPNASQAYNIDELKAFMDKATGKNWFPNGFDSIESMKEHLNNTVGLVNIEGTPTDQEIAKIEENTNITISDIALKLLSEAGAEGLKAATIREYIEKNYGRKIHDKTVGMTLYRLSERELIRRSGHTWFLISPGEEKGIPDAGASGQD